MGLSDSFEEGRKTSQPTEENTQQRKMQDLETRKRMLASKFKPVSTLLERLRGAEIDPIAIKKYVPIDRNGFWNEFAGLQDVQTTDIIVTPWLSTDFKIYEWERDSKINAHGEINVAISFHEVAQGIKWETDGYDSYPTPTGIVTPIRTTIKDIGPILVVDLETELDTSKPQTTLEHNFSISHNGPTFVRQDLYSERFGEKTLYQSPLERKTHDNKSVEETLRIIAEFLGQIAPTKSNVFKPILEQTGREFGIN